MLFNSTHFLMFFPLVCLVYWTIHTFTKERTLMPGNLLLLAASYYFYICWVPKYALLLLFSTTVTYAAAMLIDRAKTTGLKKLWLTIAIVLNLGVLCFYKYINFFVDTLNAIVHKSGVSMDIPGFDILLPVGISFFTLQALGYAIDVYRGDTKAERNFAVYALFVSFFPQLVAGPIERSRNLLQQFRQKHEFDYDLAMSGFNLMIWGYFLKLCLADRAAMYADYVFTHVHAHEGYSSLVASIMFTLQIYGDFAGYTFIAIGAARIMGFQLHDNFRRPYFASSITDFWHRWHISLSSWLRDYVYIPMGGSRTSKMKTHRNILATFCVSGLWHGANWTFVVWGALHGLAQCVERAIGWHRNAWSGWSRVLHVIITFIIVDIAWVLFRADTFSDALTIIRQMFSPSDFSLTLDITTIAFVSIATTVIFVKEWVEELRGSSLPSVVTHPLARNYAFPIALLVLIGMCGVFEGGQFIYFQF